MSSVVDGLKEYLDERDKARQSDTARWQKHDHEECMLCGAYGADKRTLFVDCLYDVREVVPEMIDLAGLSAGYETINKKGFGIVICKCCRGRFLGHMQAWRYECMAMQDVEKDHDGEPIYTPPGKDIPVRVNGATVMMSLEEYEHWRVGEDQTPEPPKEAHNAPQTE